MRTRHLSIGSLGGANVKEAVYADSMKGFVERRRLERTKSQLPGKVVFGDQSFVLDCTIRDFAAGGSCIALGNADVLPERIVLIEPRRFLAFDAEIKWRCGNMVGLSFDKVTFLNEPLKSHQRVLKMHAEQVRKEWGSSSVLRSFTISPNECFLK